MKTKGTNSPSQSARWFPRAAPASCQQQNSGYLKEDGTPHCLQMAQVTGKGKVRAVGADVSVHVAGRKMFWCLLLHLTIAQLSPHLHEPWRMLIHILQISLFCDFPMTILCLPVKCPVFVIAVGRIQRAEGRSNTANPIFLSLLMLIASPVKPLMEL